MAMTFMRTGTLDSEEARKQYRDDPEAVRQKDIVASAERIGGKVVLARAKAQHRRELGAAQLQELDPRWLDFLTETTTIDGYAKRHELESEAYEELDLVSTLGLFDGYEFRHTPDDNQTAFLLAYQLANIGGVTEKYYFEIARDGEDATNIIDRLRAVRRARLRKKLLVGSGITSAIAAVACLAVLAVTADGQGALLRVRGGNVWKFRCRGGQLSVDDSLWIDGDARATGTLQLVVSGESPADGMTISWEFKRAS